MSAGRTAEQAVIGPVVSEKSYGAMAVGRYAFRCAPWATKIEIGNAVEELFATKVASVRTINRKGKRKRNRTSGVWSSRATRKRAIVTLADGEEHIDIFGS